jgi:hypothetical protein
MGRTQTVKGVELCASCADAVARAEMRHWLDHNQPKSSRSPLNGPVAYLAARGLQPLAKDPATRFRLCEKWFSGMAIPANQALIECTIAVGDVQPCSALQTIVLETGTRPCGAPFPLHARAPLRFSIVREYFSIPEYGGVLYLQCELPSLDKLDAMTRQIDSIVQVISDPANLLSISKSDLASFTAAL